MSFGGEKDFFFFSGTRQQVLSYSLSRILKQHNSFSVINMYILKQSYHCWLSIYISAICTIFSRVSCLVLSPVIPAAHSLGRLALVLSDAVWTLADKREGWYKCTGTGQEYTG